MKRLATHLALALALAGPLALTACEQQGPVEEAVDDVGDAAEEAGDAVEDAADEVEDEVD